MTHEPYDGPTGTEWQILATFRKQTLATFLKLWLECADKEIKGEETLIGGARVSHYGLCPLQVHHLEGFIEIEALQQALVDHCGQEAAESGFPFNEGDRELYLAECHAGKAHLNARRRAFVEATLAKLETAQ